MQFYRDNEDRAAMRTCLSAALIALASTSVVSAQTSPTPSGVVFVGDMQSIDRAVLESASLALPTVDGRANAPQHPTAARASSGGVRPAAFQAKAPSVDMKPSAEEPKRRTLFGVLKAPSWLTGKKASKESTTDPFNQAAMAARQRVAQPSQKGGSDVGVQAITAFPQQADKGGVAPAAYVPGSMNQRGNMPLPMQVQQSKQPRRTSGIALRKETGPRAGLLSGLFGESKSKQPTPAAPQQAAGKKRGSAGTKSSAAAAYSSGPTKMASSKTTPVIDRRSSSAKLAPRPGQRVAARTAPSMKPTSREMSDSITASTPRFAKRKEPAGSVIMISDSDVPAKTSQAKPRVVINDKAVAPMPIVVGPASNPIKSQPPVVSTPAELAKPQAPTPLVVTDPKVMPIEEAVLEKAQPTKKPATYARTTPRPRVQARRIVKPADAEPSERSRALLAEAHDLAAVAKDYAEFTAVVQRCRYVLAIDQSKQAQAYANQLGGWALTKRGEALEAEGRIEEAGNDFQDALACDAGCWRAVHALGVLAARKGNAEEAGRRFNETIELNPEYAKAYSNRAALAVQSGDYKSALDDYQRAIEIDPDMSVAHTGRGRVCHMLGLLDQGLQHLDAAAMLDPEDGMIAIGRGDLLTDLGRYGQAHQAYRRAIQLEPNLAAAHRNLAWMQATCPVEAFRDGESALQHAEIAEQLATTPDDLTLDTKAAALAAVGRFEEARVLQREAISLASESDTRVYRERLSLYERGESFISKPVAVRQASYLR